MNMASLLILLMFGTYKVRTTQFIDCRTRQCKRSYIVCGDNENCAIDCGQSCQSSIIFCPNNANCNVYCDNQQACDKTIIHAEHSNLLSILCENHLESCYFLDVHCPQHKGSKTCNISGYNDFFEMAVYAINGFNDVHFDIRGSLPATTIHCNTNFDETCLISPTYPHGNCLNNDLTCNPTVSPTSFPTNIPTKTPTINPTVTPSISSTFKPTNNPSITPTHITSNIPSKMPTNIPSHIPSNIPTYTPTNSPLNPTIKQTNIPSIYPTNNPTHFPQTHTDHPTITPTHIPSNIPSNTPSVIPTISPTNIPSNIPSITPTIIPTNSPSLRPTFYPTKSIDTSIPSRAYTDDNEFDEPTKQPTHIPTNIIPLPPSLRPTTKPTRGKYYNNLLTSTQTFIRIDVSDNSYDEIEEESKTKPIVINLTNLLYVIVGVVFICCIVCGFCFVFNIISTSLSSFSKSIGKENNNNKNSKNIIENGFVLRRSSNSSSNDLFNGSDEEISKMFQDYQKRERTRFSQSYNNNKRISQSIVNMKDNPLYPIYDGNINEHMLSSDCESSPTEDGMVNYKNNGLNVPVQTNHRVSSIESLASKDINYIINIAEQQQLHKNNVKMQKDNKNEENNYNRRLNDEKFSLTLMNSVLDDNKLNDNIIHHIINEINDSKSP